MASKAKSKTPIKARAKTLVKTGPKQKPDRAGGTDAVALLKADHAEVAAMFERYEKGKNRMSSAQRVKLAGTICESLTVHAQIEEEIFYPAVEEQVEDMAEMLAEAKVEHQSLKRLISDIEDCDPDAEEYDADVKVLGEYVKHHVCEEETEMFPKVRKTKKLDLDMLGERLRTRKNELMLQGKLNAPANVKDIVIGGFLS